MRFSKKTAGYVTLALVLFLVAFFLALPHVVKYFAVKKIDEATGRKSQIAKVSFDPFTLTAGVTGFRLTEKGSGATFVSFSGARLSLNPMSLPKRSFIVDEIKVASPYFHIVRNAPNNFNFTDLVTGKKKEKKEGTYLFSLNNIVINNGSVDFQDKALRVEKQHRIRGMNIALPFVSNMPYLADRYVTPHFSAVVNDSPFRFDGRLKPLTRAIEATLSINLKQVDLPFYLGYVPVPLPVKVDSGRLGTALEIGYRVDEKMGPDLRISGDVALDKIDVKEAKGAPLLAVERATLGMKQGSLFSRRFDVASVTLDGIDLHASRDRSGAWNIQKLTGGAKKEQEPAQTKAKEEKKPLVLNLAKFSLKDGRAHFSDAVPPGGFKTELRDINIGVSDFSLASGHKTPFDLKLLTSKGEKVTAAGEFAVAPVEFEAKVALDGAQLKEYYPYLHDTLAAPISGKLGFSSRVLYDEKQGVRLEKGLLTGQRISASFGGKEGFLLKELSVGGLNLNTAQKKAEVESVDLKGGKVTVSSEKGGAISARKLLRTKLESAPAKAPGTVREKRQKADKAKEAAPFSYRVRKVTASGLDVDFTDRTKEDEPRFLLNGIRFAASNITGPKQPPFPLTFASGYGKRGRIQARGTFTPEPVHFKGNVELHGIPLTDFDAYLPEDLNIFVAGGALDTKVALDVVKGASGMKGSFNGSLGVRSFYCQDTTYEEDLLKWESLQMDQVKGTVSPFTLAINEVSLSNFYSRVIIEKDGTMNLQHLKGEQEPKGAQEKPAPAAEKTGQAAAPQTVAPSSAAQPNPVRIDAITMQGGTLEFSDRHLSTPFDTTFYNLGGRVSGLSSQANRFADVDLRGNLENHSPLSIKGVINPLRGDLYLDLKIAFNDIELSPLTPYSNTYLGYNVDKGKLFLNLSYKVDKKALTSENKVFIDQFTFGNAVDSPKATKLPVRLAVALLKDRKGEIHLDLPVEGRTDDPKFSVWKVVLQILKNLVVKAATSPMALLGSMVGGGHDFSAVVFEPGSDRLTKAEQEKLRKLSQALQDRPALNLDLTGYVDRERDAEGYRNEMLLRKMKGEKFRKLVKEGKTAEGQTPQDIEILPQEYSAYLKQVYVKEKFPKPRNVLGFLKDLPDAEMRKLILTHTVVGQNELQGLARERAGAVKAFLTTEGKIPPERLFEKSADIYKAPAKEGVAASRVEFGASIK